MLMIERISWRKPRYAVRDDAGHSGLWVRRRFTEAVTGEIDGKPFQLRRDARRRFTLVSSDTIVATAEAARSGRWTITAEGVAYQLRRGSRWRSDMELCRGMTSVGSIRKGRAPRGQVRCDLPSELSPGVQAFIGFLVLAQWNRAAASSGSAAVAGTS
jgi:hypothetical protein